MFTSGNTASGMLPDDAYAWDGPGPAETTIDGTQRKDIKPREPHHSGTEPANPRSSVVLMSALAPPWITNRSVSQLFGELWIALQKMILDVRRKAEARRREKATAAVLRGLSDATLKDIGVHRTEISALAARLSDDEIERRQR